MQNLTVSMVRAASEMGQLFGSVTSRDIAEAVTEAGFTITRNQVIMDRSIKTLGLTETRIRLHPEVSITVVVNIARSLAEAETQLKTGVAVTGEIVGDNSTTPDVKTIFEEAAPEAGGETSPAEATDNESDQTAN